jgi:formylglycine-generating enzyme required for sulfatase activity
MNIKFAIIVMIVLFLILSGCIPSMSTNTSVPTGETSFVFLVEQGDPLFVSTGAPYEITADNCQGARDSEKTEERSRTYSTELKIEVSNAMAAEVGGDIKAARLMLSNEIGTALGVTIDSQTSSTSSVKIITPPGNKTVARLEWKEIWTSGTIAVSRPDGKKIDALPFSVLDSLSLEQLGIQTINCETDAIVNNGSTVQIFSGHVDISTDTTQGVNIPMVLIPKGDFSMGRLYSDNENEKPLHVVFLDEYYIDKYEVTNQAYSACVKQGVCQPPFDLSSDKRPDYYNSEDYRNFPVINVDWDQAHNYCAWRGMRLPTEAEWEKAARGVNQDDNVLYPWNTEETGCSFGNFSACTTDTTEVGSYPLGASPYGVYDIVGNVWEWVVDWYGFDYYEVSPRANPKGPNTGTHRVLRGGSWNSPSSDIEMTYRMRYYPNIYADNLGFRCARSGSLPGITLTIQPLNTTMSPATSTSYPVTPNPTQTLQAAFDVIDNQFRDLLKAHIAFNKPERMKKDETTIIELVLSPSLTEPVLATQFVDQGGFVTITPNPNIHTTPVGENPNILIGPDEVPVTIETSQIEITQRMRSVLLSKDPDAFIIKDIHYDSEQVISLMDKTTWSWSVTAKKRGTQTLELIIYQLVKFEGKDFWHEVEAHKANIVVEVTVADRLKSLDWKWIASFLLAFVGSALGVLSWLNNRKKKAEEEKPVKSPKKK